VDKIAHRRTKTDLKAFEKFKKGIINDRADRFQKFGWIDQDNELTDTGHKLREHLRNSPNWKEQVEMLGLPQFMEVVRKAEDPSLNFSVIALIDRLPGESKVTNTSYRQVVAKFPSKDAARTARDKAEDSYYWIETKYYPDNRYNHGQNLKKVIFSIR